MQDVDPACTQPDERKRILKERSQALAEVPVEEERETWPVIAFRVAGMRHGVPAARVRQILEAARLSALSGAPSWMQGAIQARAQVVPVLNLRVLLGLSGSGIVDATRVILLEDEGDLFGVAVDEVEGRLELPREEFTETPDGGLVRWVGPERLGVLEVARLGAPGAGVAGSEP